MRKITFAVLVLLFVNLIAGCHYDIVRNKNVKLVAHKCVCIESLKTQDPYIGTVLRDVIEKEFIRRGFEICDANNATILISGSAFLTERAKSNQNFVLLVGGGSASSSQAIESVSLVVKNKAGEILATASYDNSERYTASKLATEFGSALADKLKK
jgi:hypothetical protein